jgi:iron complex outermembrane receptor protein
MIPPRLFVFLFRVPIAFAASLGVTLALSAQTAATGGKTPPDNGDTLQMTPFTVQTEQDRGYIAADTISGGRVSLNLLKSPTDVTVLTREFLDDIAGFSTDNAALFLTSADVTAPTDSRDYGQNVTFRGVASGGNTRDYFRYMTSVEEYVVERIEGARGPNSIIYGDAAAGGQLNVITKRALFRTFENVGLRLDSEGSQRATLDLGQRVGKNLALRLNVLAQNRRTWIERFSDRRYGADLAVTWRPWRGGELRTESELTYGKQSSYAYVYSDASSRWDGTTFVSAPLSANPSAASGLTRFTTDKLVVSPSLSGVVNFRNFAGTLGTGLTVVEQQRDFANFPVLPRRSFRITPAESNFGTHTFNQTGIFEQNFSSGFVLELAANWHGIVRKGILAEGNNTHVDVNRVLPGGALNPNFGKTYSESQYTYNVVPNFTNQYRVAAAYPWVTSKGTQTFSVVAQQRYVDFPVRGYTIGRTLDPNNPSVSPNFNDTSNRVYFWRYWDKADAPFTLPSNENGYAFTNYANRDTRRFEALGSFQVNAVGEYWKKRLTIVAGLRFDKYHADSRVGLFDANSQRAGDRLSSVHTTSRNKAVGLTYFPRDEFGFYANYSEGFTPQSSENPWLGARGPVFTSHAYGRSAGVRFRLFDGQLIGSIGHYNSYERDRAMFVSGVKDQINAIWTDLGVSNRTLFGPFSGVDDTADLRSRGYEADLTANVGRSLRLKVNLAFPETEQVKALPDVTKYYTDNLAQWQAGANDPTNPNSTRLQTNIANIANVVANAASGRALNGTYRWRANVFGNYEVQSGPLRQLRIGGGVNLFGRRLLGSPTNLPFEYIYDREYFVATGTLGYSLKMGGTPVVLSLNVSNLFDYREPVFSGVAVYLGATYRNAYTFIEPRKTTLSVALRF